MCAIIYICLLLTAITIRYDTTGYNNAGSSLTVVQNEFGMMKIGKDAEKLLTLKLLTLKLLTSCVRRHL